MSSDNEEHVAKVAKERRRRTEDGLPEIKADAEQLRLVESNRRLTEGSLTKSDFLANLNQELHTSLNSVIGFSNVLLDRMYGPLNEKQQEYVQNIIVSGKRLLSLFNDIQYLSRVESGNLELQPGVVSLRELLSASLVMLREKALKGGVSLCLEIVPQADLDIVADERKLKQIMFNLLSNAVKFTPAGETVTVSACNDEDFIAISVTDAGTGISEEDIPKLFQAATTAESGCTKQPEGTGMSLALTRQLVELHGGTIRVKSGSGCGSRFSFTIPHTRVRPDAQV